MQYQCIPIINHHRHSSTSTGSAEEVNSTLESSLVELRDVHLHDRGCVSPLMRLTDVYGRANGMEKTPG